MVVSLLNRKNKDSRVEDKKDFVMSNEWMDQFTYQIIVKYQNILNPIPVFLSPWATLYIVFVSDIGRKTLLKFSSNIFIKSSKKLTIQSHQSLIKKD